MNSEESDHAVFFRSVSEICVPLAAEMLRKEKEFLSGSAEFSDGIFGFVEVSGEGRAETGAEMDAFDGDPAARRKGPVILLSLHGIHDYRYEK